MFITDRGRPIDVLMTFEEYQRLTKQRRNIADALAMPEAADIVFELPEVNIDVRLADFLSCAFSIPAWFQYCAWLAAISLSFSLPGWNFSIRGGGYYAQICLGGRNSNFGGRVTVDLVSTLRQLKPPHPI